MNPEEKGRSSYLDLLITTLMEHEKNLDALIERLEKLQEKLSAISEEVDSRTREEIVGKAEKEPAAPYSDTLIYMRIKINRELNDVVKIIESLKE